MKIATLSFELCDTEMVLTGEQRVEIIADVIKKHQPALLLCAGYAVETDENLVNLTDKCKLIASSTTALIEVKNALKGNHSFPSSHVMNLLTNLNNTVELGRQYFASSGELDIDNTEVLIKSLEANIENRIFKVNEYNCIALCCGELNIIRGRNHPSVRSKIIEEALINADIILNPTHDGMANYGTLASKRAFLSQSVNNRKRAYISSSNWNTHKSRQTKLGKEIKYIKQTPFGKFMHSVWVDGLRVDEDILHDDRNEYHLRMHNINLEN